MGFAERGTTNQICPDLQVGSEYGSVVLLVSSLFWRTEQLVNCDREWGSP